MNSHDGHCIERMERVGTVVTKCPWKDLIHKLLKDTINTHGDRTDIDLRLSSPFVRQEVMGANTCILAKFQSEVLGFALIKKKAAVSSVLYVTLMVSFKPGVGRLLVSHLATTHDMTERFLVVRATDRALGFYLRLGFTLFNYSAVPRPDIDLTRSLHAALTNGDDEALGKVRSVLHHRNWIDSDATEWPMLLRRLDAGGPPSTRRSKRIVEREWFQHLRHPPGESVHGLEQRREEKEGGGARACTCLS